MKVQSKTISKLWTAIGSVFIILMIVAGFLGSITDVGVNPSPTGEYSIKMYWIDVGGWGWQGNIYLVKHGIIDQKYWTGLTVPASSKWLSDCEFEIDGGWPIETQVYSVYDFIH